jgi:hypothetical protein
MRIGYVVRGTTTNRIIHYTNLTRLKMTCLSCKLTRIRYSEYSWWWSYSTTKQDSGSRHYGKMCKQDLLSVKIVYQRDKMWPITSNLVLNRIWGELCTPAHSLHPKLHFDTNFIFVSSLANFFCPSGKFFLEKMKDLCQDFHYFTITWCNKIC